jgi:hypothetical protein
MNIELLHTTKGDKNKLFDDTPEGRQQVKDLIEALLKRGTVLFLERGKKTYRVKGYDPETDKLLVGVEVKDEIKTVTTRGRKAKVTAVPAISGGSGRDSIKANGVTYNGECVDGKIRTQIMLDALLPYPDDTRVVVTVVVDADGARRDNARKRTDG